ncbi:OLC1v1018389C1 [Oldenlandia corymbosa var. corymbosa]|uniref:Glycosyltransferase n=1 Tax=Oldenlandia corymbosa var. corymbosa TaxID=529605 RepID=A0AAV1EBI5_OLDCO|nr:OLC1v1018389C1 [Oldenlandia corymbosa var. corymbosa]
MEKESHASPFRIVMLPWLAHGHVSPYLELAKKLTARNFIIYLCSTRANLTSIRSKLSKKFSESIQLVELELPESDQLPSRYHTTNGLPPNLMATLKDAFDRSCPSFCRTLKRLKPNLVIYDLLQPWAPAAAASVCNIPSVVFVSSSATMSALWYHSLTFPGTKFPFDSTIFYREYESDFAKRMVKPSKDKRRIMQCIQRSTDIVLVKGFREIEGKYGDYWSTLIEKKVVHVGHLVQDPAINNDDDDDCEVIEWLNNKAKGSTIFVSFGSEYFLSNKDLIEIAHGLELSNVNFIWVVRFPTGVENISLEEILPQGFFTRVGDRGKIVTGWAPQVKILTHPNIGGFVSHCGWNSVLEGMKFGLPIIAMPMQLDQPINARLIEEVGVGIEVLRDSSGNLQRETISKVINQVVKGIDGEQVRKKAKELSEEIGLKGDEEIDEVVKELVQLCLMEKNTKIYPLPSDD